jgi:hypothetical protein
MDRPERHVMSDQYIDILEEGLKLAPREDDQPHFDWRSNSTAELHERMIRLERARESNARFQSVKITTLGLTISLWNGRVAPPAG